MIVCGTDPVIRLCVELMPSSGALAVAALVPRGRMGRDERSHRRVARITCRAPELARYNEGREVVEEEGALGTVREQRLSTNGLA